MLLSLIVTVLSLTAKYSLAAPAPDSTSTSISSAPIPQSTACSDIVNSNDSFIFDAKTAYECLTSVPFNPAVATRFLQYYNETLQFQSTLAYLKNPPPSYQQPAVNLLGGLEQIQRDIDEGAFQNQYAFEATLQNLLYSAHDAHLTLNAGVLAVFTFGSPYAISTVSIDGIQLPKVYITEDLLSIQEPGVGWQVSAIAKINGQDVIEYLSQFAAVNAIGSLETHADWNQLMASPALDIQYQFDTFEGYTTFYPGENITFTFENGTQLGPEPWLAIYNFPDSTGPLTTGGDFYNFFVLGFYPASYNPDNDTVPTDSGSAPPATVTSNVSSAGTSTTATPSPTSWENSAYPDDPNVVQPDLGGTGVLTGYFFNHTSTAVLSIPSFQAFGDAVATFSDTIGEFLRRSKQAGMTKVVIDVQQNGGGNTLLAVDAFKRFFPLINPFGGSRLGAHTTADILGNTFTNYYDDHAMDESTYYWMTARNWVATSRLNADSGQNFTSWGEFFGPHMYNGEYFTTTQRNNLSSLIFDVQASGGIVVYGYADNPVASPQPYPAEDIIILTDGLCSSACAVFVEMMHHEAGVRTVAVGGRPSYGPMQAPSGSRGAQFYTNFDLDLDFQIASKINTTAADILPNREEEVWISSAGITLRDQIRKGEDIPLQFVYEAANCRIFYTPQTFYNFTNLWKYAADAIWLKPELCVKGSTGYATNGTSSDTQGPPSNSSGSSINTRVSHNMSGVIELSGTIYDVPAEFSGQQLDDIQQRSVAQPQEGALCSANRNDKSAPPCSGRGFQCRSVQNCKANRQEQQCVRSCTAYLPASSKSVTSSFVNGCQCQFTDTRSVNSGSKKGQFLKSGFCVPYKDQCNTANRVGLNNPAGPPQFDGVGRGKGGSGGRDELGSKILDGLRA